MVAGIMRAALVRRHALTFPAVKCMVKEHGCYGNLLRIELIKYIMGIKCAVVIADTCMVSADNKVCAAVVFPYQGMEYCLLWPGISHCRRVNNKNCPILRIIAFKQHLVTPDPYCSRHIISLCLAYNGVYHKAVNSFHCALLYIFMRPVNRVSRLKTHNPFPALFLKQMPGTHLA